MRTAISSTSMRGNFAHVQIEGETPERKGDRGREREGERGRESEAKICSGIKWSGVG
jgi:hypothetical protein